MKIWTALPVDLKDRGGSDPNTTYVGDSCVIDSLGNIQADMPNQEGILRCEIDTDSIRQWRKEFPTLKDADFR